MTCTRHCARTRPLCYFDHPDAGWALNTTIFHVYILMDFRNKGMDWVVALANFYKNVDVYIYSSACVPTDRREKWLCGLNGHMPPPCVTPLGPHSTTPHILFTHVPTDAPCWRELGRPRANVVFIAAYVYKTKMLPNEHIVTNLAHTCVKKVQQLLNWPDPCLQWIISSDNTRPWMDSRLHTSTYMNCPLLTLNCSRPRQQRTTRY